MAAVDKESGSDKFYSAVAAREATLAVMSEVDVKKAVERFLKSVDFNAQRELEKAVRKALAGGKAKRGDVLTTAVTLANEKLDLDVTIFSKIEL
jgi:hypothetical protein